MDEKLDVRKNTISTTNKEELAQEYAYQYDESSKEEEYQYPQEDKRITYHVDDEDDTKTINELYNVDNEETIAPINQNSNKIKVKINTKDVAEDHRQRSYKIKTQPQIYSKTDIGIDNFQNKNDAREDEINKLRETSRMFADQIEKETNTDMTNPIERYSIEPEIHGEDDCAITFNVGDKVKHTEEGIEGEVKFANDKRLAIVWEDQTRERFTTKEAKQFLKITKAYTDIQEQIDPIHTPDYPKNKELDSKIDNALSSCEKENEIIETDKIDLEKVKMQRKINELQNKVTEIDVEKIKTKVANELIELMRKKGMLSNSEEDIQEQFNNIMEMDDTAFESFKKVIVSTKKSKTSEDEIYSILGEDEDFSDIEDGNEFAKQRELMKKSTPTSRSVDGIEMGDTSFFENGGLSNFKGTVGDFSKSAASLNSTGESETRSLSTPTNKQKTIKRQSSRLDMSGFQDIQGLKAPINIPNKDLNVKGKFDDLFSNLGWSGIPKK